MAVQDKFREYMPDQREFFDRLITEDWETYFSSAWDAARRLEAAQVLASRHPRRVLDIGCGCGFHDREMAAFPFVERVDAFDYSTRSVEKAEMAYPHSKVHRFVADLASFSSEEEYDLVVSFQVFEHFDDPELYLDLARSLCSPGGRVCIVTPNRRRLDNRLRTWRGEGEVLLDPQHFKEYSIDELRQLGRRHGLLPLRYFGHTLFADRFPWLNHIPGWLRLRLGVAVPSIAHIIGIEFGIACDAAPRG